MKQVQVEFSDDEFELLTALARPIRGSLRTIELARDDRFYAVARDLALKGLIVYAYYVKDHEPLPVWLSSAGVFVMNWNGTNEGAK